MYTILIEDRNKYMVSKIMNLKETHKGKILVVVGAGHVEGMEVLLKEKLIESNGNDLSMSFMVEV